MMPRSILVLLLFLTTPVRSQETGTPGSPFSQAKFVPDISLILDCSYLHRNVTDEEIAGLFLPGYVAGQQEFSREGFNLNYAEIGFSAVVDPYFELFAVCHLSEERFELEEAYWSTKQLPAGFQLKAGKFLSSFGRINDVHTHYWDFADRPLVHAAFFGQEGLNDIGARVTWVAPIGFYLLAGGEVLMGGNEGSFGRTGFRASQGVQVDGVRGPGLVVGYVESSVDIGEAAVLARVSGAHGKTRSDEGFSTGAPGGSALSGTTTVLGAALTAKLPLDAIRDVSFQGEWLWRHTDATHYSLDLVQRVSQTALERRQSGFYAQVVAKFSLRMRGGFRYDLLQGNAITENGVRGDLLENLPRLSTMLEYSPTEFSRIRLQYTYDRSRASETAQQLNRTTVNEVSLQVNLAIGAHGAHSF
jgi:hypothetical protein